jgi:hypothetical protein
MAFVGDGPFDLLAFLEVHALGNGGGKIDVPLLAFFALDQLNFGRIAHE